MAQLHAQRRRPAEGDIGLQGDVALGMGRLISVRDYERFGGEQLFEVRDRLRDVDILRCRRGGQDHQRQWANTPLSRRIGCIFFPLFQRVTARRRSGTRPSSW
jgi:hypothetical protein